MENKNNIYRSSRSLKLVLGIILILSIFILSLNLTSAEVETLPPAKQGTCVSLPQECGNCTYNNITSIRYPNGTSIITQFVMTKSVTSYNYTFCRTLQLGEYVVCGKGDIDGITTPWCYNFNVSGTGLVNNLYMVLSLLIAGFLLFIIAVWTENEYFGFISGVLFIVGGVFIYIYGIGDLANLYTRAIAISAIGLGLILEVAAGYKAAQDGGGGDFSSD